MGGSPRRGDGSDEWSGGIARVVDGVMENRILNGCVWRFGRAAADLGGGAASSKRSRARLDLERARIWSYRRRNRVTPPLFCTRPRAHEIRTDLEARARPGRA